MRLTVARLLEDAVVVPIGTTWHASQIEDDVRINVLAVEIVPVPPSCSQRSGMGKNRE